MEGMRQITVGGIQNGLISQVTREQLCKEANLLRVKHKRWIVVRKNPIIFVDEPNNKAFLNMFNGIFMIMRHFY